MASGLTTESYFRSKNLIVIGDRILIKPGEAEEKTEVGLILPQTVQDRADMPTPLKVNPLGFE